MNHDPERSAAWYLGGQFSRRKRRDFEDHMLECEDCWREVESGRSGRTVAESARELAPQALRERVRSTIAALEAPPRRWRPRLLPTLAVTAVLSIALVAVFAMMRGSDQPTEIELAVANFSTATHIGPEVAPDLPDQIDGFDLVRAEAGMMGTLEVTAHTYEDAQGDVVVVYRSVGSFPIANDASHTAGSLTWTAQHDGALLFCSDRPAPTLVVGKARGEVMGVAEALDLR